LTKIGDVVMRIEDSYITSKHTAIVGHLYVVENISTKNASLGILGVDLRGAGQGFDLCKFVKIDDITELERVLWNLPTIAND
jgi:hypothetical protein